MLDENKIVRAVQDSKTVQGVAIRRNSQVETHVKLDGVISGQRIEVDEVGYMMIYIVERMIR